MNNPAAAVAGAILTIDLGAIRQNYLTLKSRLGGSSSGVEIAGVIKADGYGLGHARISAALMAEGCTTFCVAQLAEAIALRDAIGPQPVIYALNGLAPGSEQAALDAGIRPVLNSLDQIAAWRALARQKPMQAPAALQVDSGMSRMGLSPLEVDALSRDPALLRGIDVTLVMSHLACADEPDNPANAQQLAAFQALRAKLPDAPASFANSSGVFLNPSYHFDLARPGVALYGVNPTPGRPNPMLPVVQLHAKVIQTREIGDDVGIGYGFAARARQTMRLATISLGYADGWPRRAAGFAFFNGVKLPFAGRVSMDSIILDITALEPGRLQTGDLVELIGPNQSVDDVAGYAGTIGYEILTGLGGRFHRRYIGSEEQ